MSELRPDIEEIIEKANSGDGRSLERLYGMGAAYLRDGKAIPSPLTEWVAEALEGVAHACQNYDAKDRATQAAQALKVRRQGERGRSINHQAKLRDEHIVKDIQWLIECQGFSEQDAIRFVTSQFNNRTGLDQSKLIRKAWREAQKGAH